MRKPDANIATFGALEYYQFHYIVKCKTSLDPTMFLAKCTPITTGYFRNKRVIDVSWSGGRIAETLEADRDLNEKLKLVLLEEGEIKIDPIGDYIRIYSKWKQEQGLKFDAQIIEVINTIAYHIKQFSL